MFLAPLLVRRFLDKDFITNYASPLTLVVCVAKEGFAKGDFIGHENGFVTLVYLWK